jgi:hypothetical protein
VARIKPARLEVSVDPFGTLPRSARDAVGAEVERIAPFRDCKAVEIGYTE